MFLQHTQLPYATSQVCKPLTLVSCWGNSLFSLWQWLLEIKKWSDYATAWASGGSKSNGPASASTQSKHDFKQPTIFNQQEPNTSTERMMIKYTTHANPKRSNWYQWPNPNLQQVFRRRHTIHSHAQQLPEHSCVEIAAELESETVHMQCAHVDNTTHSYTVNYAHQIKLCDKLGLMKPDAVSCCSSGWSIKCSNW